MHALHVSKQLFEREGDFLDFHLTGFDLAQVKHIVQ